MGGVVAQLLPGTPHFTEKDIPSLIGKVFIVTGGNSGVGFELVKILYSKGGTVYIASRSPTKVATAIEEIKSSNPQSQGHLKSLHLDLGDLTTILPCATAFLAQESRLDVLWNNAGIARAPVGSLSAQGHEAHMGTNCLGHYLLTKLLLPVLIKTARVLPKASVRVVFTYSGIVDIQGGSLGVSLAELGPGKHAKTVELNYGASKTGNWLLPSEFDKRYRADGVVFVTQTPGTLKNKGFDELPWAMKTLAKFFIYEPVFGAYTELWCGLSSDVKAEDGGRCAIPWGRWHPSPRKDILEGLKLKEEGGTGLAADFWDWCEENTKMFAGAAA
ncbi:Short-chain dehydrogenase reductase [Hyphodiscus hymeniophilus]|uniref:Short-chain dehydrogenase reductase n=1 Tax=Hyphodiscus hymeniophilus TaxID=353542 RepID=A0A9P6VML6_9HELO|nr:Short-chain dehydrogenase reductase [Hyphodiscus hymeniophilus]